ncbi:UDP-N-acetylmuramoyl-L-alanine--D-glutamate ligase [Candidatus Peregrinibacteria bacterium]|nr:UDP-N-acetylmuramoyl-L-alanine--D-glutamate ligase [Candidatus Peregrinibacteria bacterium]
MKDKLQTPIAILGFGTEGQAALAFLKSRGIKDITICDQKEGVAIPSNYKKRLGEKAFDDLSDFQTIIRSPGVRYDLPGIQQAHELGALVTSMTKLTLELAADRITAITGTNGKTTTTALCEQILSAHYGGRLIVGGNDRQPILQQALQHPDQPILIEASSFQFEDLKHSPYIAAILNITPNHLDWHDTLEAYIAAKTNILRHQQSSDWAVLNATDENVKKLATSTPAQPFWINEKEGDSWAVWEDGYLKISFDGKLENVLHFDQLSIKTHPDNLLFAAAIAKLHFVPLTTIEEQIKLFKGVEHRLEFVRTLKDIHFYNDSSSTSPESAMTAIDQFLPDKLILLLGGSSKKADFTYLAEKIVKQNVRIYLYGTEGQAIKESILSAGGENLILDYNQSGDFKNIITSAYKFAKPEDAIVLSPACASFDMFKNAKDRGNQFKEIISSIS